MRKIALVFLASVALLGSACGGGSDKKDNASVDADAGAKVNTDAAALAAARVCDSREAVAFGSSAASAGAQSSGGDFSKFNENLHKAADAAPSEIKADFRVFADGVGPFLEAWASANGDYMKLAQDPSFQTKAQKASDPAVKQAADHINAWFTEHCSG